MLEWGPWGYCYIPGMNTSSPRTHLIGNTVGGVHDDEHGFPCEWIEISRMKAAEK